MNILFCHGLDSGPHGAKSHALQAAGHHVAAPDCRTFNLLRRVEAIGEALSAAPAGVVVVGSSFGGLAAVCALMRQPAGVAGLVLCAPALHVRQPPAIGMDLRPVVPTIVVHGTHDQIVPLLVSRDFCQRFGCELVACDDDHRLTASLPAIVDAVERVAASPLPQGHKD